MKDLLTAIAADGLPTVRRLPTTPVDARTWPAFLSDLRHQRIGGLCARAVANGALPTTEEQRGDVVDLAVEEAHQALVRERRLLEVDGLLSEAGITYRLLKGPSTAHRFYPDPALRSFADLDLLVKGDDIDAGIAVLVAAGARRPIAQLRPGFDRRFGKGATLEADDGIELDVHRTFSSGPFGLVIDADALFDEVHPVVIGGRSIPALAPHHALLSACFHAALGDRPARLVPLRDVAQIADHPSVDLHAFQRDVTAWGVEAVVAYAVNEAWATLGLQATPLSVWAAEHRPSARQRRLLEAYGGANPSWRRQAIATLLVVRGVRPKVDYVRAVAFPDRAHLASRGRSTARPLARLLGRSGAW